MWWEVVIIIVASLPVAVVIFFRLADAYIKYRNRQAGKKYCEKNGLIYLKTISYELHTRLYFRKDNKDRWANYKTDKDYQIKWMKEKP
jgi:hypothetical protein